MMQHIKNFRIVDAPVHRLPLQSEIDIGVIFLASEDGQDWYECQALFSDNTVKLMYDAGGIICALVNKPVPQRGDVYAVSMLWPVDMSVVEMAIDDCPAECQADGAWRYTDGRIEKMPTDYVAAAESKKAKLMAKANSAITPLQDAVDIGEETNDEAVLLLAWKKYRVQLMRVNTKNTPGIEWPPVPTL